MKASMLINDGFSPFAAGTVEIMQVDSEISSISILGCAGIDSVGLSFMRTHWVAAGARFTTHAATIMIILNFCKNLVKSECFFMLHTTSGFV